MTWFRVDDGFQRDPKVLSIPRAHRGPAVGLWLLAGTWSAANLTDGLIPDWLPDELGVPKRFASVLVTAGLWAPEGAGWRFTEWAPNQPTRAQVEDRRAKRAESGRLGGKASGAARRTNNEPTPKQVASPVVGRGFNTVEPPARPGPARPETPSLLTYVSRLAGGNARDTSLASLPPELITEWQDIAGPDVDLEVEAAAYLAHHADRPARNERSAWLGWLKRARSYAEAAAPAAPCQAGCLDGWVPDDAGMRSERRCLVCRPSIADAQPPALRAV
jgi:hypothetical protein